MNKKCIIYKITFCLILDEKKLQIIQFRFKMKFHISMTNYSYHLVFCIIFLERKWIFVIIIIFKITFRDHHYIHRQKTYFTQRNQSHLGWMLELSLVCDYYEKKSRVYIGCISCRSKIANRNYYMIHVLCNLVLE